MQAVAVRGKFLYAGEEKFYIRGVCYGTFSPGVDGGEYGTPSKAEADFQQMAAAGVNSVRTYTVPPVWFLDLAAAHGLRVMVGLAWEQHIAFLDEPGRAHEIVHRLRAQVRHCQGHRALLCFTIGNEVPASIVRWHGKSRIENFLHRLYRAVKEEAPHSLVTYINFPTTEYLNLPFLDFFSFNVYLENRQNLEAYLYRLQNIAGEKPLVMAEIGLDSRRNGLEAQAESLEWQIRASFAAGCAGVYVFSWTDEWHRGGFDIEDWDFGLTTRERQPKPALRTVGQAFREVPFPEQFGWPRISVVVCSYNGQRYLAQCLEHLSRLAYPNYEVILVDDGSRDRTAEIGGAHGARVISVENGGLSRARNIGMEAATGEIVTYIDDDAYPDPHWLHYLGYIYATTEFGGAGGPNLPPPGDGLIADCVARAPGGPIHVLVGDREAEHIPGCNSSFRKAALKEAGGFDPAFRAAGDDVDLCWRVQEKGWKVGFHPAAVVWHHRRNSIRAYWKQQAGYGKAEALLERKWPERYDDLGHLAWRGRIYAAALLQMASRWRSRIYSGGWGLAGFQSLYDPGPAAFSWFPQMPEWYLVNALLAVITALGWYWKPLLWTAPLLAAGLLAPLPGVVAGVRRAEFGPDNGFAGTWARRLITALLHFIQPLARLTGRFQFGLTPWRANARTSPALRAHLESWSEKWYPTEYWLEQLAAEVRRLGARVRRGGEFDEWDLEIRDSLVTAARLHMAIEEHGGGKQLIRWKLRPRISLAAAVLGAATLALSGAAWSESKPVAAALAGLAMLVGVSMVAGWLRACGCVHSSVRKMEKKDA
ncbi:MAG: glycosyltransferase [Acidimicrobiia bacterium]|nr:glycosyltransferase [Acidimicrobiia bacterium]